MGCGCHPPARPGGPLACCQVLRPPYLAQDPAVVAAPPVDGLGEGRKTCFLCSAFAQDAFPGGADARRLAALLSSVRGTPLELESGLAALRQPNGGGSGSGRGARGEVEGEGDGDGLLRARGVGPGADVRAVGGARAWREEEKEEDGYARARGGGGAHAGGPHGGAVKEEAWQEQGGGRDGGGGGFEARRSLLLRGLQVKADRSSSCGVSRLPCLSLLCICHFAYRSSSCGDTPVCVCDGRADAAL
jgi:hypothetical protein